jgi:hypothetical protein
MSEDDAIVTPMTVLLSAVRLTPESISLKMAAQGELWT